MAFFDLFRRLSFFRGRNTAGMTAEDLDFEKWVEAHRAWRRRLTDHINGTSEEVFDEETVCRDDRCALGQWIHGHGTAYYGDLEVFRTLRHHHADFHQCAGKVIRCFRTEGAPAAKRMMRYDFDRNSFLVISDLKFLESTIKN